MKTPLTMVPALLPPVVETEYSTASPTVKVSGLVTVRVGAALLSKETVSSRITSPPSTATSWMVTLKVPDSLKVTRNLLVASESGNPAAGPKELPVRSRQVLSAVSKYSSFSTLVAS